MTERRTHLRLVAASDVTSEPAVLCTMPQPPLPFDGLKPAGITIIPARSLTGQEFRRCLEELAPATILDVRGLPRLDFVGYSRSLAFDDFRRVGARYARASVQDGQASALELVRAIEGAGLTRDALSTSATLLLVYDDEDATSIAMRLTDAFARVGWTCSVSVTEAKISDTTR